MNVPVDLSVKFKMWAKSHPSAETEMCLLHLESLERGPQIPVLVKLACRAFWKLEDSLARV